MYQFLVSFTVQPDHRDDFVKAAKTTARDSLANEPGSERFEVSATRPAHNGIEAAAGHRN
jgi:autoinducer 2-degrading protein